LSCQIKNGKYYAPNGKESILYKDLEKEVGAEKAKELFVTSYTKTFQDKVINPLINSYKERVKNLLPLREDVTFKVNGIKTTHIYSGKEKIGRIQTENYKDGVKIKSVLVDDKYKGQGFGTALYNKLIQDNLSQGLSVYSDQFRTEDADRIWESLKNKGLTKGKVVKAVSEDFDANGEISAEKVLEYFENNQSWGEPLKATEITAIKQSINQDIEDLYDVLREAFYKGNIFSPTQKSLKASGIYSEYEIGKILEDVNLQATIYSTIQRLKHEENSISVIQFGKEEFISKTSKLNSIGKLEALNPLKEENLYIEENGGLDYVEDQKIPLDKYKRIPVLNEKGEAVQTEMLYEKAVKVVEDENLIDAIEVAINAPQELDITKLENAIAEKLKNYGIDISTLSRADLPTLLEYIKDPSVENTIALEKALGFEREDKQKVVSISDKNRSYVYLETNKTEQQLFNELSLVQTNNPNVFHKVNKVDSDEIIAFIKERDGIEGILTELEAYKKYFEYTKPQIAEEPVNGEFTGDLEYLKNNFIADFAAEKLKNPNKFNENFKITERDIELISNDPLTIDTVKAYIKDGVEMGKEMEEYSLISRNIPNLTDGQKANTRVNAINNYKNIPQATGKFIRVNDNILATVSETKPYVMQDNDLFEMKEKDGNLNFYAKLEKNADLNYYEMSPNAPQEINTAEFKHLQTKEDAAPKIKKLAKAEELADNFQCT
jgi:GNAT superfamily N-acetyltransferase